MEFKTKKSKVVFLLLLFYNLSNAQTVLEALEGETWNNAKCANKTISQTSCSQVVGAILNDDLTTSLGKEYDWNGANGNIVGGTSRALIEIGNQCWFKRNAVNLPSNFNPSPNWDYDISDIDVGWSGYYQGGPFLNEGRLYQWSAVMNGTTYERSQGVCPTGWHVPSDCEWQFLENTLGMNLSDQQFEGLSLIGRQTGNVGSKLSLFASAGNNSSGFSALLTGFNTTEDTFQNRGATSDFWTSTRDTSLMPMPGLAHFARNIYYGNIGVRRYRFNAKYAMAVRCLKD